MPEMRSFTRDEFASGQHAKDVLVVIDSVVYDLSKFVDMHPGGAAVLLDENVAGKDATDSFFGLHRPEILDKPAYKRLRVGTISGERERHRRAEPGELSRRPYAEPIWLNSAYTAPSWVKPSHRTLQAAIRKFYDEHVKEEGAANEITGERPSKEILELMGSPEWEILAMRMGPGKHLHGRKLPGGVKPEEFDYFHELVLAQELTRIGAPGYMAGLNAGMVIGLPPIINGFARPEVVEEVLPDILRGKKFISLAISEAHAGSDVQGINTIATLSEDKSHFIVNGSKKWITNGHWSDWFTTAVRTEKGLSMLLIPRVEGVETRIIKTAYSHAAGTAYVTFDHVKVPAKYLLGELDKGLKVILSNFNHERWVICARTARYSRFIVEETWKWASTRKVFGKTLLDQPTVRQKFARMFVNVEMGQQHLEALTYQMCSMDYKKQSELLAGPMALLKYALTRQATEIASDAVQILGGRGITVSGMGRYIEQYQRTFKFDSILGGSEEILAMKLDKKQQEEAYEASAKL